jgi:hypothetical protein
MDHCDECDAAYIPTKVWQRFCSLRCRNAYHRRLRQEDRRQDEQRGYLVASRSADEVLALAGVASEFKRRF